MIDEKTRMDFLLHQQMQVAIHKAWIQATAPGGSEHRCDNCGRDADCYHPLRDVIL